MITYMPTAKLRVPAVLSDITITNEGFKTTQINVALERYVAEGYLIRVLPGDPKSAAISTTGEVSGTTVPVGGPVPTGLVVPTDPKSKTAVGVVVPQNPGPATQSDPAANVAPSDVKVPPSATTPIPAVTPEKSTEVAGVSVEKKK